MVSRVRVVLFVLLVAGVPALQQQSADPVLVGFYAESLCPDCMYFANGPVKDAFKEVGSIFTLNYVPWGNAKITSKGMFECQHGKMECTLNTVEACVIHYYPKQSQFWPFIYCMDSHVGSLDLHIAEQCASELSMNWTAIDACTTGELGYKLELFYANETASLDPPHQYTPWVTINGKHDYAAEGSGLTKQICKAYKGQDKPKACSEEF